MQRSIGVAWIAGVLIAIAAPVRAQTTLQRAADALNRPDAAPVESGRRTTIIVPRREVIVVERVKARRGWWKHPRYRVVTVYYDGRRFYRRPFDRRMLRKIVVYERAGRYYIDQEQWQRDRRRHYGHDEDKWKDDDDRDGWKRNHGRHEGHDDDKHRDKDDHGRHHGHDDDKHKDKD